MMTEDTLRSVGHDTRKTAASDMPVPASARTVAGEDFVRIEQVAVRTGLTKRTLRYYEEIGLLAPPTRTEGGYRLYSETDIQQLERIKRLKDLLGFSLSEIREIARSEEERAQIREAWKQDTDPHSRLARLDRSDELLLLQLRLIDEKLAGLQEMRAGLQAKLDAHIPTRNELLQAIEREQTPEQ